MDTTSPANEPSVFESFPEYHNFPAAWDLSEIDAPAREQQACPPAPAMRKDLAASELIPVGDNDPLFGRDPFPKLRTFPVYWDMPR